jgi:membrane protein
MKNANLSWDSLFVEETMATTSTLPHVRPNLSWFQTYKNRVMEMFTDIGKHRVLMLAAAIAYTTAVSLAPFILILLAVASLLGQQFQNQIYIQMTALLGEQAGAAIRLVVENADNDQKLTTISGLVGFAILVVSASVIFSQLRAALDIIDELEVEQQGSAIWAFFRDKILSVGLVLGFLFLAITSLAITTIIAGIFDGREAFYWQIGSSLANLAIFTALFTVMFHYIPSERNRWWNSLISGLCATVFFLLGKHFIGLYLGQASVGSAYGAAGSLVVFLVWVYYTTFVLLVSYEFANNIFLDRSKDQPL